MSGVLVVGAALVTTGCSSGTSEPSVPTTTQFETVHDGTASDYYKIGPTAEGTTDEFGSTLILNVTVLNANQIKFKPKAAITWGDGSTTVCVDEDLRHVPALISSTTSVELPCPDGFPGDPETATVDVTDEYN